MKSGTYFWALRCAAFGASLCAAPAICALPGDAKTTIVNPGTVTNANSLDFGAVIPGSVQSRLRVPPTSDTISVTAGNAVPTGGAVSRARFDVVAAPLTLVFVTLPSNIQLTRVSGSEQMLLDQFQQSGSGIQIIGLTGQYSFFVGGTLNVGQSQTPGSYNGTFTVAVNFL